MSRWLPVAEPLAYRGQPAGDRMSEHVPGARTIGRYQILRELGRGAMGIVYEGYDPVIGRRVALKTMAFAAGDADSQELRTRLFREAAAAGTLAHPNIVTIYDVIDDGQLTAVAMELVDGQTLNTYIGDGRALSVEQAIPIFEQIGDALDYAGARGIVHRDIKPANILLTADGRVKILDFGIARISLAGVTQTSSIMGSPSYMSPEQVRGLPLDPRSDLFSAAVVLFEMLTGERPFGGDDVATTMYRIVHEPPRVPLEINPAVSPAVAAVLEWGLAKDPSARLQSGAQFTAELRRAASEPAAAVLPPVAVDATMIRPAPAAVSPVDETRLHAQPATDWVMPQAAEPDRRARRRSPLLLAGLVGSGVMLVVVVIALVIGRNLASTPSPGPSGGGGGAPSMPQSGAAPRTTEPPSGVGPSAAGGREPATSTAEPPAPIEPAGRATAAARDARALPGTSAAPPGAEPTGRRAEPVQTVDPPKTTPTPATPPVADAPPAAREVPAQPVQKVEAAPERPAGQPGASTLPPPPALPPGPRDATAKPAAAPSEKPAPDPAAGAPPKPAEPPAVTTGAVLRVSFDGQPYPVTLYSGETRLGRVDAPDSTVDIEAGSAALRAVSEAVFLNADLGTVAVKPGERRTVTVPGLASAAFAVRGEDYTGVRILIDGKPIPGPYPAQVGRIAAGMHRVVFRWVSGPAAGREVTDTITLASGGHFVVRASLESDKLAVQQLR